MLKKAKRIKFIIALNLMLFILSLGDFAALHDIANDYVSAEILTDLGKTTSTSLPAWTATTGEWQFVTISLVTRVLFLLLTIFLLWSFTKTEEKTL